MTLQRPLGEVLHGLRRFQDSQRPPTRPQPQRPQRKPQTSRQSWPQVAPAVVPEAAADHIRCRASVSIQMPCTLCGLLCTQCAAPHQMCCAPHRKLYRQHFQRPRPLAAIRHTLRFCSAQRVPIPNQPGERMPQGRDFTAEPAFAVLLLAPRDSPAPLPPRASRAPRALPAARSTGPFARGAEEVHHCRR